MTRISIMTIATTSRMWINPPIAVEVTIPSSHRTSRTIATVVSMETLWRTRLGLKLLAGGGLAGGHRHHDPRANGDEDAGAEPYRRDAREHTGLPQAERDAHDDDEIADEKEVNESHVDGTTIGAAAARVCAVVHTRNCVHNGTDAPPGDNWGQEFVYPKRRALQLAKLTNLPVLYIPDDLAPNLVAPVRTADDAPVV